MDVEHAAPFNGEPDLVLAVRVLLAELGQQGVEVWRGRRDVDHVGRDEVARLLQPLDFGRIRFQNLLVGRLRRQPAFDVPLFVPDAVRREVRADLLHVGDFAVLVLNADPGH